MLQKLANGSLYIKKVYMEDMGKYGCTAGNNGGLIRTEMYLHVEGGCTGGEGKVDGMGKYGSTPGINGGLIRTENLPLIFI